MTIQYAAKALYAAATAFLAAIATVLVDGATVSDITQGQWVVIAGFALAAAGGVFGLQAAPANVATSTK